MSYDIDILYPSLYKKMHVYLSCESMINLIIIYFCKWEKNEIN